MSTQTAEDPTVCLGVPALATRHELACFVESLEGCPTLDPDGEAKAKKRDIGFSYAALRAILRVDPLGLNQETWATTGLIAILDLIENDDKLIQQGGEELWQLSGQR